MISESELLELRALLDIHEAATLDLGVELGLQATTLGSAFVSIAARLPPTAIVINRTLGLGRSQPESRETIDSILDAYRQAGVEQYFIQVSPDAEPRALEHWLTEGGLIETRAWQKFSRGREPVVERPTDLSVREIGPEHGEDFGRISSLAFDLGEEAAPWLAKLPGRGGWHVFMSFDHDKPAGVGAMYVHDGLAWLDFGATSPDFRKQGSQSAIMARRLQLAMDLGCTRMFTCTGVDVPGDPQHSYKNILRAGFSEDYVRKNFAPPESSQ